MNIKVIVGDDEYRAMGLTDEQFKDEIKARLERGDLGDVPARVDEVILVVTPNSRSRIS